MQYPHKEWNKWYVAQKFGNKTSYGYHEGSDLNRVEGGNSDYGYRIYAIADGIITFVQHLTNGFGSHIVYKIDGPWGSRWVHSAHCIPSSIKLKIGDRVREGDQIALVGHSGNSYNNGVKNAHHHYAIAKREIKGDIAKNLTQLESWEDPIKFIEKWLNYTPSINEENNQEENNMQIQQLLEKYNVSSINDLDQKIEEHVGSDWGATSSSGYLGGDREKVKRLESQIISLEDELSTIHNTTENQIKAVKQTYDEIVSQLSEEFDKQAEEYEETISQLEMDSIDLIENNQILTNERNIIKNQLNMILLILKRDFGIDISSLQEEEAVFEALESLSRGGNIKNLPTSTIFGEIVRRLFSSMDQSRE